MRVEIWGARGSLPAPGPATVYYGGNTACVCLRSETGELLILDAGSGIRLLGRMLMETARSRPIAGSIFISHFHWDHILGLPFFAPLYSPNSYFSFFSFRHPESSFQELIEAQMGAPYFPVKMSQLAGRRDFYEVGEQRIEVESFRVTIRRLNHPQGCLSFRVESGGRVVTYATDHEPDGGRYDANLMEQAADADVLLLDAQYTPSEYENGRRGWGHGTWESAVEVARAARVQQLLLFHHDPDRSDRDLHQIVRLAQQRFPDTVAAAEGMVIHLSERHQWGEQRKVRPRAETSEFVVVKRAAGL